MRYGYLLVDLGAFVWMARAQMTTCQRLVEKVSRFKGRRLLLVGYYLLPQVTLMNLFLLDAVLEGSSAENWSQASRPRDLLSILSCLRWVQLGRCMYNVTFFIFRARCCISGACLRKKKPLIRARWCVTFGANLLYKFCIRSEHLLSRWCSFSAIILGRSGNLSIHVKLICAPVFTNVFFDSSALRGRSSVYLT